MPRSYSKISFQEFSYHKHLSHAVFDRLWKQFNNTNTNHRSMAYQFLGMICPRLSDDKGEVHFQNLSPDDCRFAIKTLLAKCLKISDVEAEKKTDEYFTIGINKLKSQGFFPSDSPEVPDLSNVNLPSLFFSTKEQKRTTNSNIENPVIQDKARIELENHCNSTALSNLEKEFKIMSEGLFDKKYSFQEIKEKLSRNDIYKKRSEYDKQAIVLAILEVTNDTPESRYSQALEDYISYVKMTSQGQYRDYYLFHTFEETVSTSITKDAKVELKSSKTLPITKTKAPAAKAPKQQTQKVSRQKGSRKEEDDDAALDAFLNETAGTRAEEEKKELVNQTYNNALKALAELYKAKDGGTAEQFRSTYDYIKLFIDETDPKNPNLFILLSEMMKVISPANTDLGRNKYFDDLVEQILEKLTVGKVTSQEIKKAFTDQKSNLINASNQLPQNIFNLFLLGTLFRMVYSKYDQSQISSLLNIFSSDKESIDYLIGVKSINNVHRSSNFLAIISPQLLILIIEQAKNRTPDEILAIFTSPTINGFTTALADMAYSYDTNPEILDSTLGLFKNRKIKLSENKKAIETICAIIIERAPEKLVDILSLLKDLSQYDNLNIAHYAHSYPDSITYLSRVFESEEISDKMKVNILTKLGRTDGCNALMTYLSKPYNPSNIEVVKSILKYSSENPELFKELVTTKFSGVGNNALQLALLADPRIAELILDGIEKCDQGKTGKESIMHQVLSSSVSNGEIVINPIGYAAITANEELYNRLVTLYEKHNIPQKLFHEDTDKDIIVNLILGCVPTDYENILGRLENAKRVGINLGVKDFVKCVESLLDNITTHNQEPDMPISVRLTLIDTFEEFIDQAQKKELLTTDEQKNLAKSCANFKQIINQPRTAVSGISSAALGNTGHTLLLPH